MRSTAEIIASVKAGEPCTPEELSLAVTALAGLEEFLSGRYKALALAAGEFLSARTKLDGSSNPSDTYALQSHLQQARDWDRSRQNSLGMAPATWLGDKGTQSAEPVGLSEPPQPVAGNAEPSSEPSSEPNPKPD